MSVVITVVIGGHTSNRRHQQTQPTISISKQAVQPQHTQSLILNDPE